MVLMCDWVGLIKMAPYMKAQKGTVGKINFLCIIIMCHLCFHRDKSVKCKKLKSIITFCTVWLLLERGFCKNPKYRGPLMLYENAELFCGKNSNKKYMIPNVAITMVLFHIYHQQVTLYTQISYILWPRHILNYLTECWSTFNTELSNRMLECLIVNSVDLNKVKTLELARIYMFSSCPAKTQRIPGTN